MTKTHNTAAQKLPNGVMLNAYPDSIGSRLSDIVDLLKCSEMRDAFSLFYILPTLFHSDLDRGFSIIDYDLNEDLASPQDLDELDKLGIKIKLDLVVNHLSVRSPQFKDLLVKGDASPYKDFFIDWNAFWEGYGSLSEHGYVVPEKEYLDRLFMRKPELPILMVRFKDGALKAYWNTFYKKVSFKEISAEDFINIRGINEADATDILKHVNCSIESNGLLEPADLEAIAKHNTHISKDDLIAAVCHKREFLGQLDVNARSKKVWAFYEETLRKLHGNGAKIIRLDAFAYLHKEPGQPNFFNRPGTWHYLQRLRDIATKYDLVIFPEIHAQYGTGIHEEISREGYPIYDFFFPGLVIDALDRGRNDALLRWIKEILSQNLQTINMLGCHDGIPILDLKGIDVGGTYRPGLLSDELIEETVQRIIERGGLTKNLYDAEGKKIDYYQVNATFFSALGEDEQKLRLARAIQMFMPGLPQVWYLDLFAGTNDYAAVKRGLTAGHKEINRTTLSLADIERGLQRDIVKDQIRLIRLRNTSPAFTGELQILDATDSELHLCWQHPDAMATLHADLEGHGFTVSHDDGRGEQVLMPFES